MGPKYNLNRRGCKAMQNVHQNGVEDSPELPIGVLLIRECNEE
jgi:hypothetical protein